MGTAYQVNWKDETKVNHYLGEIMKLATVHEDGRVSYNLAFEVDAYEEIITHNVNIKGLKDLDRKKPVVRKAIARFARYSKHSLPLFRVAMETELRRYYQMPTGTFHILFPINIRRTDLAGRRWFNVLGTRISCRTWSYLNKHYDLEPFLDDAARMLGKSREEVPLFLNLHFCPLTVSIDARTSGEAFGNANEAFDILRTLINLTTTFGKVTYQYGGRDRPLGQYLLPPIFGIFKADGSYALLYFATERYDYRGRPISGDQIALVDQLAKRVKQPDGQEDVMTIVVDALRKYGQAMDTVDWQQAFLSLWQVLELVALQTAGRINMQEVANRIANLLGLKQNELMRDLLDCAVESRNDLVHRGRFSQDGLREVNYLKVVVDRVIDFLLSPRLRAFPTTKRLENFYVHATVNDADLQERRRVIQVILDQRSR